MFDNCISQVKHDAEEYQRLLNAIERNKKDLENWKGKPKYEAMLSAIEYWQQEIYQLEKTLFPAMEELKEKMINRKHLQDLGF